MGVATGRDSLLDDLLAIPPDKLRIILPTVCVMEALSAFEDEEKRRNRFTQQLDYQISQLRRDITSANASSLLANLESARIKNGDLLDDVEFRLNAAMQKICSGRVELLPLMTEAIRGSMASQDIDEPTDNLILAIIKNHAHSISPGKKVLLTGNTKDFHVPEIKQSLESEGFVKLFSDTRNFIGWFNAEVKRAV